MCGDLRVWEMRLLAGGLGLDLSPFAFEITGCVLEFLPLKGRGYGSSSFSFGRKGLSGLINENKDIIMALSVRWYSVHSVRTLRSVAEVGGCVYVCAHTPELSHYSGPGVSLDRA